MRRRKSLKSLLALILVFTLCVGMSSMGASAFELGQPLFTITEGENGEKTVVPVAQDEDESKPDTSETEEKDGDDADSENDADANGGGIFIGWGTAANVKAGEITDNECAIDPASYESGARTAYYGGGGIYVQGDDIYSGKLTISGVEITDNNAVQNGGGVAGCPYSEVKVYFDASGVIYGNNEGNVEGTAPLKGGEEVYITAHKWDDISHPQVKFSPFMLGGGAYNWTDSEGRHVAYSKLDMTLTEGEISLYNSLTAEDESVKTALDQVTVHITDNTSYSSGGGIGTNGTVEVGKPNEELDKTIDLSVQKTWNDAGYENQRPGSIVFELYQNGEPIETYVMSSDESGQWPAEAVKAFQGLPKYDLSKDGNPEYTYEIREEAVDYYTSSVEHEDGATVWTFQNTYTTTPTPGPSTSYTSLSVEKVWADAGHEDERPSSVQVQLYRDDEPYGGTVTLSEANGWSHEWTRLNDDYTWTIGEVNVPEGYTSSVSGSGTSYTITNTYDEPDQPDQPDNPPPEEDIPDNPPPLSDLPEDDTPLADIPEEKTPLEDLPDLPEEDVPLADVPETGDVSLVWMLGAAASAAGLIWLSISGKKKEDGAG